MRATRPHRGAGWSNGRSASSTANSTELQLHETLTHLCDDLVMCLRLLSCTIAAIDAVDAVHMLNRLRVTSTTAETHSKRRGGSLVRLSREKSSKKIRVFYSKEWARTEVRQANKCEAKGEASGDIGFEEGRRRREEKACELEGDETRQREGEKTVQEEGAKR